ncbi:ABC transporter substrate-binding protein [Bdellovibrio sp. KM01]|uniref:substrate-binding periplasmic protein n=1 Tax=Bdellovibrio sp. KM01 TaxID=2748865 RepID=UPI0015EA5687|nr:transporter substrate-binding domain-containing protein [Bdellovibrio sp. KM01]QLY23792.1 transporter substrate-binding domain-containing protein [Bdellovibrio sp. KM01]
MSRLFALLLVVLTPLISQAQDGFTPVGGSCEKRYVLSFQDDAPGFFVDKNNKKNGTAYELLLEIVRRLGCKSTEQITPYLKIKENFLRNKSDIYALSTQDKEMDKVADFVEMYSFPRSLVVNKKDFSEKDNVASLLKNPKIVFGNVTGGFLFIQPQERAELEVRHRLREFPGPTSVFNALLEGRIQATFSSPAFTYYFITREKKMEQFRAIPDPKGGLYHAGFYLARRRLTDAERAKIREIIRQIRADGTLLKIASKYVNPEDLIYYKPIGSF